MIMYLAIKLQCLSWYLYKMVRLRKKTNEKRNDGGNNNNKKRK